MLYTIRGFLININRIDINWSVVAGLAIGGTLMAPFAALLAGKLPKRALASLVAVAIILINGYRLILGI